MVKLSHLDNAAFEHTAFSGAVVTDKAAIHPRPQQAKPAHTDQIWPVLPYSHE